jgi:hypothetical protein
MSACSAATPEDLDLRAVQPEIEFPTAGIAKARLDDDGRLQQCGG